MNTINAERTPSGCAAGASSAGLVSSKTTVNTSFIDMSKPASALRRVKRLKRSVWASGHLHGIADHGHRSPVCWFVTLTYRGVNDWQPDHIKKAINAYRRFCKLASIPCRYTWVAELQKRGAVHYHLLCWLPHGVRMPLWDKPCKSRDAFWSHGMSNTQKSTAGVGYLMKYLSKLGELTIFPKGLRLYGIGGLNEQSRKTRAWYNFPQWVKNSFGVGEVTRGKHGFMVQDTGEILPPAFSVSFVHGTLKLSPLRKLSEFFTSCAWSKVSF